MTKTTTKYDDVLDEQTLQLLSDAPAVQTAGPEQMQNLRDRVMRRVDDDISTTPPSFLTDPCSIDIRISGGPLIRLQNLKISMGRQIF